MHCYFIHHSKFYCSFLTRVARDVNFTHVGSGRAVAVMVFVQTVLFT